VLNDHTVARLRVFGEQAADHWLFEEQVRRWAAGPLTPAQRREVERLSGEVTASILALAEEFKGETIERLLTESDLEVGRTTAMAASISGPPRGGG
jgi:hypothetical protein